MIKKILWTVIITSIVLLPVLNVSIHQSAAYFLYIIFSFALGYFGIAGKTYLRHRSILIPLLVWLLITFFTSFYALDKSTAFTATGQMLFFGLIFIVLSGLDSNRKKQIALALAFGSFLISIVAIWQYFFFFDKILPSLAFRDSSLTEEGVFYIADLIKRRRVTSIFVNPNLFASYLAMVNIVIISLCFIQEKKILKIILSLLLIMNCYTLWLTRSLAGLLSFILGVFLFILLFSQKSKLSRLRYKRLLIFLGGSLVILFIVLFIKRLIYDSGTDCFILSLRGRLEFWKAALKIIGDRPFQFTGLGGFGHLYRHYCPQIIVESRRAHNIFLQLWVETGIWGLLAFIWFLAALIHKGLRQLFKLQLCFKLYIFQAAGLAALSAFLFHNLLDFSFFVTQVAVVWWVICSWLINSKQCGEGEI
jgi:O-antigen ligase